MKTSSVENIKIENNLIQKSKVIEISEELKVRGFSFIKNDVFDYNLDFYESFSDLKNEVRNIPFDVYDKNKSRKRIYGRYTLIPWLERGDDLIATPGRHYEFCGSYGLSFKQPANLNQEEYGKKRVFDVIGENIYNNSALKSLIRTFWSISKINEDELDFPVQVGVHIVKMEANPGEVAFASPNRVHCDGEPYTFATLVGKENVSGGRNVITDRKFMNYKIENVPQKSVKAEFTLDNELDSYVVSDEKVAHYVSPVMPNKEKETAQRTILLIDYTPLRPALIE